MSKRLQSFLIGIMGVLVGFAIVDIIRDGKIDWSKIGSLMTLTLLISLFILGLNLYKKTD